MKLCQSYMFAALAGCVAVLCDCTGETAQGVPFAQQSLQAAHRPPPSAELIAKITASGIVPKRHPNHARSWIRPDVAKQWLLYVSDMDSGTVDIYAYRNKPGQRVGQITGFAQPQGQCVDSASDVYVTDFVAATISEYAHGSTKPSAVAFDDYGYPVGCSVDPTTGNVAVANLQGFGSDSPGGIDVFEGGGLSGTQTNFTSSAFFDMWPPAYDPSGNLFFEAAGISVTALGELPADGNSLKFLSGWAPTIPGAVQWDGHFIAATDQSYESSQTTAISRLIITSSGVLIARVSILSDSCDASANAVDAMQPFVAGTTPKRNIVVAGNTYCPYVEGFWNYAYGGDPKSTIPYPIAPVLSGGQSVSPPTP
jgi:hypothetical protein